MAVLEKRPNPAAPLWNLGRWCPGCGGEVCFHHGECHDCVAEPEDGGPEVAFPQVLELRLDSARAQAFREVARTMSEVGDADTRECGQAIIGAWQWFPGRRAYVKVVVSVAQVECLAACLRDRPVLRDLHAVLVQGLEEAKKVGGP